MPEIKVKGVVQDFDKTVKNDKSNYSTFFLTINTNQRYQNDDTGLTNDVEMFEETLNSILNHIDQYVTLPDGVIWNDETVENVDIDFVIEKGGLKNCVHCHALLKFKHNTKIKLDYKKINQKICSDLGLNNVYLLNKIVKSNATNIVDYLNKYVKK